MQSSCCKVTLAYDGTRFAGWQKQKNARTVQSVLEQAFERILGRPIRIVGAGRTDSGVHAEAQVAHIRVETQMPLARLQRAVNAVLPEDVLVLSIRKVPSGFHAQYSAKSKWYRYTLWNHRLRPVSDRNELWHVPVPLDLKAMKKAARWLKGRHDFKAFASTGRDHATTVRHLKRLSLRRQGPTIRIDAEADGFLYHMVRRIVGFLVEVGKGRVPPSAAAELLDGKRPVVAPTAPAKGLSLIRVTYL